MDYDKFMTIFLIAVKIRLKYLIFQGFCDIIITAKEEILLEFRTVIIVSV